MSQPREYWNTFVRSLVVQPGHYVFSSGLHGDAHSNFVSCNLTTKSREFLISECYQEIQTFPLDGRWHKVVLAGTGCGYWYAAMVAERLGAPSIYIERDRMGHFVLRRDQERYLKGSIVLLLDDVLSTGTTAKRLAALIESYGVPLVGALFLLDRSITQQGNWIFTPHTATPVKALFREPMQMWPREECPLCKAGTPFSVKFGNGEEEMFLHGQPQKS